MKNAAKFFVVLLLVVCLNNVSKSQDGLNEYLSSHQYPFSLQAGFDARTTAMLEEKLGNYKLVLQAQGGSHYLHMYTYLAPLWLSVLNEHFGATVFFNEAGHSASIVYNRFLQTGDTSLLIFRSKELIKKLYQMNLSLPESRRLKFHGIDFESPRSYVLALQLITPAAQPPVEIASSIALIKNANPGLTQCDYITDINKTLKKELGRNTKSFMFFFGENFRDFERIVTNGATCNDTRKNRNPNLAANFLSFDKEFQHRMYYAELGGAHTMLSQQATAASIINESDQFKNKVCVVNLYCANCTTAEEGPSSNWSFGNIEKDIAKYFLPLCTSNFTLFDLTGDNPLIKKFQAYGQFLIIARNQN
ncbi:MAG: hypothetical protein V4450_17880 [Bacteroidota bacterium]